jgi:hypothetical protein
MFWPSITNIADDAWKKLIQTFFLSGSSIPCATKIECLRTAKTVISSLRNLTSQEPRSAESLGFPTQSSGGKLRVRENFSLDEPILPI